jgi:hypothetical protein
MHAISRTRTTAIAVPRSYFRTFPRHVECSVLFGEGKRFAHIAALTGGGPKAAHGMAWHGMAWHPRQAPTRCTRVFLRRQ